MSNRIGNIKCKKRFPHRQTYYISQNRIFKVDCATNLKERLHLNAGDLGTIHCDGESAISFLYFFIFFYFYLICKSSSNFPPRCHSLLFVRYSKDSTIAAKCNCQNDNGNGKNCQRTDFKTQLVKGTNRTALNTAVPGIGK